MVGAGMAVYFQFADDRENAVIGYRGVALKAQVTSAALPGLVSEQLRSGLERKGYRLVQNRAEADKVVTFYLQSFSYVPTEELLAVMAVEASRGARKYTNAYRFFDTRPRQTLPSADEIDDFTNEALNTILQKALSDVELDIFLTQAS
jgi:hypothetical protein